MNDSLSRAIGVALSAAEALHVEAVLIGAVVSELAADEMRISPPPRGTNDADFAVHLRTWADFDRLKAALIERGFRPVARIEHRFSLDSALIDIVPFGAGITNQQGEIQWPESQGSLVVVGFEEACSDTTEITLPGGIRAKHVTVPGLILLKIVAFKDRKSRGDPRYRNDAEDLMYWFRNYPGSGAFERRFDVAVQGLADIDFDCAGAAVLGMDVSAIVRDPLSDERVRDFVRSSSDPYCDLANAVVPPAGPGEDAAREHVVALARAFGKGYSHHRQPNDA